MKLLKFSISRRALIAASSFLLGMGFAGLEAYADYCYFEKPSSWTGNPCVWAWNNSNGGNVNCCFSSNWPGDEMNLVDEAKNLYRWDSPNGKSPNMIIISDSKNENRRMRGMNDSGDTPFTNGAIYKVDGSYTFGDNPIPVDTDGPGAIVYWFDNPRTVTVQCENADIYITPYDKDIVKIFTLQKDLFGEERPSISVCIDGIATHSVDDSDPEFLIISILSMGDNRPIGTKIKVNKSSGLVSFYDSSDNLKLSEAKYLKNYSTQQSVSFAPMNDAAFYGGGYNGEWANIKNHTLTMNNTQRWGWALDGNSPRCITIPFAASTSGYGVLFDDHYRGATMTPSSTGLKYSSSARNPISYYYIGGDNLDEVVANYTLLTGRQMLPPYWALGYITSRYSYWSEQEAQGVINDIKGAGIPLDGIVFDLGWEGASEAGMGNLNWYTPNFPNPQKMMKDWKDQGIHTIVITEPYFSESTSNYSYPLSQGYFADPATSNMSWVNSHGNVGLLDASNPEALDWMWTFYRDRTAEGMSGWWLDLGEPEQHDGDAQHMGGSVEQVHNEFGQLWIERVYRGLREEFPDMRPFLMPRSGTSGMQRFSTFPWTGDIARSWAGLASQIPSLINMSMAGVSYLGSDVGGFADMGGGSPELYLRWVEFAALSPMMRTHSANIPEPTNDYYSSVLPSVKKFINLRYRLLPYTYTLSYLNTTKGWPMARPACAFDADPSERANINDAYLWGKDIYVAPVLSDASSRSITFPDGEWIDFNDFTKKYIGGQTVNYNAPLSVLPYFMRRGSFIPMFTQTENFGSTSEISYDDITVLHSVNIEDEATYEGLLFEDDRTSASSLDEEAYSLIRFKGQADGKGNYMVSVKPEIGASQYFMPETRTFRFSLLGYEGVHEPVLNISDENMPAMFATRAGGESFVRKNSKAEVDNHDGHAYCTTSNGELYMKTVVPSTSAMTVTLGDIDTGIDAVEYLADRMRLEYVAGTLNYLLPSEYENAFIEFIAPDGTVAARETGLSADGFVHSIAIPVAPGFYIARLKASNEKGHAQKTIKFMH